MEAFESNEQLRASAVLKANFRCSCCWNAVGQLSREMSCSVPVTARSKAACVVLC